MGEVWRSEILHHPGFPSGITWKKRLHKQNWSMIITLKNILMIIQGDLAGPWICLWESKALKWQIPAWLVPSGSCLNCLQQKVPKVDLMQVRYINEIYVSSIFACEEKGEESLIISNVVTPSGSQSLLGKKGQIW